ncbi:MULTISPECIES: hypothetical protein [Desulfobacula]|uniref:Conserved uncharacterized protein n=2 Tax=Desulfobacula TaxID=28222 RepID=K0NM40_DESTT|nr:MULTISPECIES: hypothetical protein [Desulfobacula]CCK81780.1 conserved uncharacterized protein [Desulfobacula toluolica Tol2]SDT86066.1 hypothetical protein SAMN04487931_102147 [Desulfobacula phenolica]
MSNGSDTKEIVKVKMGRIGDRPYWVLIFSIFVRALHQVGAGVFLASFLLKDMITLPPLYLILVAVSGVILMVTEGLRHRQLFREVSGFSTILKLVILGLAYHKMVSATLVVLFVFILASICSHAPKFIRHRLLF